MADEAVPDHGLEGLGQGRYPVWIDLGNKDDHVAVLSGVSAVPAHDPEHLCRTRLGQIDRMDNIGTDLALGIAAADRIDQDCILIAEMTGVEPCCKDRIPSSSLVRAVSSETLSTGL